MKKVEKPCSGCFFGLRWCRAPVLAPRAIDRKIFGNRWRSSQPPNGRRNSSKEPRKKARCSGTPTTRSRCHPLYPSVQEKLSVHQRSGLALQDSPGRATGGCRSPRWAPFGRRHQTFDGFGAGALGSEGARQLRNSPAGDLSERGEGILLHEHELRFSYLFVQSAEARAQRCAEKLGRAAPTAIGKARSSLMSRLWKKSVSLLGGLGQGKNHELFYSAEPAAALDPGRPRHHDADDDGGRSAACGDHAMPTTAKGCERLTRRSTGSRKI